MVLRSIYTIFIGILYATFVGVGIAAFYPAPVPPTYPETSTPRPSVEPAITASEEAELMKTQAEYNRLYEDYREVENRYTRNVSIISLAIAIITLVVSLIFVKKIHILADALLLGSVLILIYSIIRGFSTDDNMFRFIVVSAGLALSIFLGYVKFIKSAKK